MRHREIARTASAVLGSALLIAMAGVSPAGALTVSSDQRVVSWSWADCAGVDLCAPGSGDSQVVHTGLGGTFSATGRTGIVTQDSEVADDRIAVFLEAKPAYSTSRYETGVWYTESADGSTSFDITFRVSVPTEFVFTGTFVGNSPGASLQGGDDYLIFDDYEGIRGVWGGESFTVWPPFPYPLSTTRTLLPGVDYTLTASALSPAPGSSPYDSRVAFEMLLTPIPEPSTALLLGSGLAGLAACRPRRRRD